MSLCEASIFSLDPFGMKFLPHDYLPSRSLTSKFYSLTPSNFISSLITSFCPETFLPSHVLSIGLGVDLRALCSTVLKGLHPRHGLAASDAPRVPVHAMTARVQGVRQAFNALWRPEPSYRRPFALLTPPQHVRSTQHTQLSPPSTPLPLPDTGRLHGGCGHGESGRYSAPA